MSVGYYISSCSKFGYHKKKSKLEDVNFGPNAAAVEAWQYLKSKTSYFHIELVQN